MGGTLCFPVYIPRMLVLFLLMCPKIAVHKVIQCFMAKMNQMEKTHKEVTANAGQKLRASETGSCLVQEQEV